jgi:hypothetical protein
MKLKEFTYSKNPGEPGISRKVFVFQDAGEYVEGIDITKLDPSETQKLTELLEQYDKALAPYVAKAYRKFKKSQIAQQPNAASAGANLP